MFKKEKEDQERTVQLIKKQKKQRKKIDGNVRSMLFGRS